MRLAPSTTTPKKMPEPKHIWAEKDITLGGTTVLFIPSAAVDAWRKVWPCAELSGPLRATYSRLGDLLDHNQRVSITAHEFDAITTDALGLLFGKHPAMRGPMDERTAEALRPYLEAKQ